jgi:hypothetical protein
MSTSAMAQKKPRRILDVLLVVVVIGVVAAGAVFQEPLLNFFKLQMWDREAPVRAASSFVQAMQKRDRASADRLVGNPQVEPQVRNGKWIGYHIAGLGFQNDMPFADLTPDGKPAPKPAEYSFLEGGSALVRIPNRRGKPVSYTMKLVGGAWKVTDIRVGS